MNIWLVIAISIIVIALLIFLFLKKPKTSEQGDNEMEMIVRAAILTDDVKAVLVKTDELLGKLPEKEIEKFSQSVVFETYKHIVGPILKEKRGAAKDIIKLFKQGVISKDEARRMLNLPGIKRAVAAVVTHSKRLSPAKLNIIKSLKEAHKL